MAERVTRAMLESVFNDYVFQLDRSGVDVTGIQLHHGSKTYGNSFKATMGGHGAPGTQFGGFIGWTKREAYDALHYMARALGDVRYYREDKSE